MNKIDFKNVKNIYFIGIKGGGMTALALLFKELGKNVFGSDTKEVFYTDQVLNIHGIQIDENFPVDKINNNINLIIYSTAYKKNDNEQLKKAEKLHIPILSYPQALGILMKQYKTIAVAGTHGKTTVSAMLGFILLQSGFDPSAIIGSNVPQFSGNSLLGKSEYLVVETDEYQNKFQYYNPEILLLNNIDWDHPDFFSSEEKYKKVFFDFIRKIPQSGFIVANIDNKNVKEMIVKTNIKIITISQKHLADWQAIDFSQDEKNQKFSVIHKNKFWGRINLQLFGEFNISNALMALATAVELGAVKNDIISALQEFKGTERRFEFKGKFNGALIFDDFAHHPEEIKATLKMARQRFLDKNIIIVFHPHTFSRTDKFKDDFANSFINADQVIVLDIYSSARERKGEINSLKLTDIINSVSNNAKYIADIETSVEFLKNKLTSKDVLITMGAGDVWRLGVNLMAN